MIEFKPTTVEVVSHHGTSITEQAWFTSRPRVTKETYERDGGLEEVLRLDLPLNELNQYVLTISCPILIRELLFTPRDHVAWAITSRNANLIDVWEISDKTPVDLIDDIKSNYDQMLKMKAEGHHQDSYRAMIPMAFMSTFTTTMSFRHILMWINTFYDLASKYDHLSELFIDIAEKFVKVIQDTTPVKDIITLSSHYKKFVFDQLEVEQLNETESSAENILVIRKKTTVGLRAQAVRQRTLYPVDNYFSLFLRNPKGMSLPQSTPMTLQLSGTVEVWSHVVSKRSCWIAQSDIWSPFVDGANTVLMQKNNGNLVLPCDKGVCPFHGDAQKRVFREDPAPPCPRHAHLHLVKDELESVMYRTEEIITYGTQYGKPMNYWKRQIETMNNKVSVQIVGEVNV